MQDFLDRPYRKKKVRQQRLVMAAKYHDKLLKRQKEAKIHSGAILVPPKLTEIAEASLAGVPTTDTEDFNSGPAPTE
jgi:hypothetical protein